MALAGRFRLDSLLCIKSDAFEKVAQGCDASYHGVSLGEVACYRVYSRGRLNMPGRGGSVAVILLAVCRWGSTLYTHERGSLLETIVKLNEAHKYTDGNLRRRPCWSRRTRAGNGNQIIH